MSGFRPKAEVAKRGLELPFIIKSGHSHSVMAFAPKSSIDSLKNRDKILAL